MTDPLDGTAPFMLGASTSTVIIGLYSALDKVVKAVSVGDLGLRRRWFAYENGGCWLATSKSDGTCETINVRCGMVNCRKALKCLLTSITTAIGGEWDVAGALLVMEAGGVAAAYAVDENDTLREVSPLDPYAQDILILANNQRNLDALKSLVIKAKEN